ncbi:MAG: Diphthamide biosynthesis protein 2 [Geoglossum umbratile]|nr:MAG: Diphthamide biosynthesis protein 2 [Geoglossum umbratile]
MATFDAPPVLSTPDSHIFEEPTPARLQNATRLPGEELYVTYEIERTVSEIRQGRWRRIALQFPDEMLVDAPRVYAALDCRLKGKRKSVAVGSADAVLDGETQTTPDMAAEGVLESKIQELKLDSGAPGTTTSGEEEERLYILADTSYGSCCVDEIAAEHIDADGIVHYGRTCLSPTARLPVIYVFTTRPLPIKPVVLAFQEVFPKLDEKVVLMADVTYANHVKCVYDALCGAGYTKVFKTDVIHSPSSLLPNRTVPEEEEEGEGLGGYKLFHISEPPASLLLILSSRLESIYIYPTTPSPSPQKPLLTTTTTTLRRRYALITSLTTVPVFGILINTLSVKNYLHIVTHIQRQILAAGKKAYTFVVGKVNAAKLANFSEIGGWVVVGCWESSLLDSAGFYKPVITPFELGLVLMRDDKRLWTGEWVADFNSLLERPGKGGSRGDEASEGVDSQQPRSDAPADSDGQPSSGADLDSEPESTPPDYDLRTGRYISHTRPMAPSTSSQPANPSPNSTSLTTRHPTTLAAIAGKVSPGAEYLRSQRTWRGLGSDFVAVGYEEEEGQGGTRMQEGRSGIARGYRVGEEGEER